MKIYIMKEEERGGREKYIQKSINNGPDVSNNRVSFFIFSQNRKGSREVIIL